VARSSSRGGLYNLQAIGRCPFTTVLRIGCTVNVLCAKVFRNFGHAQHCAAADPGAVPSSRVLRLRRASRAPAARRSGAGRSSCGSLLMPPGR
jgi:hypothetical protein